MYMDMEEMELGLSAQAQIPFFQQLLGASYYPAGLGFEGQKLSTSQSYFRLPRTKLFTNSLFLLSGAIMKT